jgi:serine/threonine-protein kinase
MSGSETWNQHHQTGCGNCGVEKSGKTIHNRDLLLPSAIHRQICANFNRCATLYTANQLETMSPRIISNEMEQRKRVLFEAVMHLPEGARLAFVESKTEGDPALRNSVLRLLAANREDSDGILDKPLYERKRSGEAPPASIGAYTVVKHLGSGGMGSVYSCRAPEGGMVAVKLLHGGLQDRQIPQRFEEERAIHSRLRHPNVCRILGGGSAERGTPFIVMELVDGEPIDAYCHRNRLAVSERLRLFSQVLAGTEYFHRAQIVHRDLKPSNVLVTTAGRVKILDFGIAKVAEHQPGFTGHGPTRTTLPLMTVRYASPEQLQRRLSGRSSDIYSLGVLLYELLTDQHPFNNECQQGATQLLAGMSSRSPDPPSAVATARISSAIDRMVLNSLQYDPSHRYGSASQFLEDLRGCLTPDKGSTHRGSYDRFR